MSIMTEGVFGPVHAVTPCDDVDGLAYVVARANDTPYGLAASVRTRDIATSQPLADGIKAGAVFVNMPPIPDVAAPWGGYKQSGWGREMGPQAIDAYTETKAVWLLLRRAEVAGAPVNPGGPARPPGVLGLQDSGEGAASVLACGALDVVGVRTGGDEVDDRLVLLDRRGRALGHEGEHRRAQRGEARPASVDEVEQVGVGAGRGQGAV